MLRRRKRLERRSGLKRRAALFSRTGQRHRSRKRLPRESRRRRAERPIYNAKKKAFLRRNPFCCVNHFPRTGILAPLYLVDASDRVWARRCGRNSRDVHHRCGRGRFYLDESTWLAICRKHHDWIHENGREAERLGYIVRVRA